MGAYYALCLCEGYSVETSVSRELLERVRPERLRRAFKEGHDAVGYYGTDGGPHERPAPWKRLLRRGVFW